MKIIFYGFCIIILMGTILLRNAKQIGLSTAAQELEIKFDEQTLHRALADSRLEAACFRRLLQKEENNCLLYTSIRGILWVREQIYAT